MAQPTDRQSLIDYCFRRLGDGAIDINVTPEQADDAVDNAIDFMTQFHFDGVQKIYAKLQVDANAQTNGYFQLAANVVGVSQIFILSSQATNSTSTEGFNMFDINYQIRLNELYDLTSSSYDYFAIANMHIRTLEMLFVGEKPIRYNRYNNLLYIDMDWNSEVDIGNYIIAECYAIDNDIGFWADIWLKQYTTALIGSQWGRNLSKFLGTPLPGGVVVNGDKIKQEWDAEILRLQDEVRLTFEQPAIMLIG